MRYSRSYRFVFASSHWMLNLLAGAACQIVPVLGPIVFTGYAFEVIAAPRQSDEDCPAFDFTRLGPYLMRGLWPLIVQLLVMLPVLFLAWIFGMMLIALIAGETQTVTAGPRVLLAVLVPLVFGIMVLLSVVLVPLTLYVGLRQEITGNALSFARSFLKRVGRETVRAQVFLSLTGASVVIIGTALFCVPGFAALALVHFAQYHLVGQLYQLYQERGGAAIPPRGELSVENEGVA